ncbi:MAG: PAS domain-containing protein [Candidatus Hydrogenedentes bacterium]|nr:PAS domain-containing protein [Candidatus Hydrogenedentota bacterium]
MGTLADLVAAREDWLIDRILRYARERDYVKYTSTLAEAWRISIAGLSASLLDLLKRSALPQELNPDEDYSLDSTASFGVLEAQRHRSRGVTLGMFLGLMKYYRQAYLDLVYDGGFAPEEQAQYLRVVERFFDRIEIGFCTEWSAQGQDARVDELQSANRRLTNEKNKYVTVLESLHIPAILLGPAGALENLNHAAAEVFEGLRVPGAAYYGDRPLPKPLSWLAREIEIGTKSGQVEIERELETLKGVRWFRVTSRKMLDVSGKFHGTVVLFNDITEERQTQTLLRYRGVLARLVSDISTEFVGLTPEQTTDAIEDALGRIGRFAGASAAFAARFSEDGNTFSSTYMWPRGAATSVRKRFQSVDIRTMSWWQDRIRQSEPVALESVDILPPEAAKERRLLRRLGIRALMGVPVSFQGTVAGFIGICSDSGGKKWDDDEAHLLRILGQVFTNAVRHQHAEATITRERNLLRTLIDNLPDYIYVKDTESRFVLNNTAHLRLLRAESAGAVAGKTDFDIFPKPLAARYFADEQAVVHTGRLLVNREEEVIDENGKKRWLMTTKAPFVDAKGNVAGIVGMSRNITDRKIMEESLKNHTKLLQQANVDLKHRNQDLDEFTYVASHDLQEPLRKITAFSDALREDMEAGDRDAVLKDIEILSSGAQRMQRLVQDLLALSRSGRQRMIMESVALDECVDNALDALEIRIKERSAEIIRSALPTVRGDASMLTQLYQNLIGNALKFCETAPHIRLTAAQEAGGWVFGVADNGIGIKPEYAKQVFAPFKRLHGRGRYEGTGIGLAICRRIVERHGGAIWVESELGAGAHFKFTLTQKREA